LPRQRDTPKRISPNGLYHAIFIFYHETVAIVLLFYRVLIFVFSWCFEKNSSFVFLCFPSDIHSGYGRTVLCSLPIVSLQVRKNYLCFFNCGVTAIACFLLVYYIPLFAKASQRKSVTDSLFADYFGKKSITIDRYPELHFSF
jgi:hypothetical protein